MLEAKVVDRSPSHLHAMVWGVGPDRHLWWEVEGARLAVDDDTALLPLLLPTAMHHGVDLHVHGSVSPRLLEVGDRSGAIQHLLASWHRDLRPVAVVADGEPTAPPPSAGVGSFFSGGLDSFHTAMTRRSTTTHLVHVHGFDIPVGAHADDLARRTWDLVGAVADELDLLPVRVTTNSRSAIGPALPWGPIAHGAHLAAVAHLLAPTLGHVRVPATFTVDDLRPWGTHPLLDPLWSSERVAVTHDGWEATRAEKARVVAASPAARRGLRVCFANPGGAYNCCRCRKCIQTMMCLEAVGALTGSPAFPEPLRARQVLGLRTEYGRQLADAADALARAHRRPDLVVAARAALVRNGVRRWAGR